MRENDDIKFLMPPRIKEFNLLRRIKLRDIMEELSKHDPDSYLEVDISRVGQFCANTLEIDVFKRPGASFNTVRLIVSG